ncbi:MAG: hypothetical protein K0R51_1102 [Cytophagaceae bacterium]|jgi:hypothetical protein|nr:hypothetical protein [Cytophagaceae bacterium]
MKEYLLENCDWEDIEDFILRVEESLDIHFMENELAHVKTFGELCDSVLGKIQLEHSDTCTTQQAFYKLRNAIIRALQIKDTDISPETPLKVILPRSNRIKETRKIEEELGFKLSILRPPYVVTGFFIILFLSSFIGMFFNVIYGISGLIFSVAGIPMAYRMGKELDLQTVGQVAEQMRTENYMKSRRDKKTFNKNEIEAMLTKWFVEFLYLDENELKKHV